jgi:aryl-alcohol dehydrogenase-like predicted oxidoreductase
MAQGSDVIPIPSSKSLNHLEDNIKSINIKLSAEELNRLNMLFAPGAAAGPRTRDMHRVNV